MAKLTYQQKLDALAYRFYQGAQWVPKAGDYYTTSRADLELYQVVSIEDGIVRTRFTEGSDAVSEWPEAGFLTEGFGPRRVFVPEWVINAPTSTHVEGSDAEKIALLEERITSLEDELYEARQAPWPEWAKEILKTLRKYGYDPVVDGEVDLGEAFKDYLEGVAQAEEYDKKRYREIIERAQAIISTSTYPNWHKAARDALATTEGKEG